MPVHVHLSVLDRLLLCGVPRKFTSIGQRRALSAGREVNAGVVNIILILETETEKADKKQKNPQINQSIRFQIFSSSHLSTLEIRILSMTVAFNQFGLSPPEK